ncbi:hypothetical protein HIM_12666 [Hirsutella minnesotensis 3608]|uniref:Uncharacterized protein n=1 Tax=Hirsutella minnesotensis 3608 TaxID=1043627 RepID=A0A0F7ZHS9_9HYPO|nr:hypothetical protein HIM_12666 [Hirsutella minnesotensis 3608]
MSVCNTLKKRCRGPGRKPRPEAPECEPRFLIIDEGLRLAVSKPPSSQDVQNFSSLIKTFQCHAAQANEQISTGSSKDIRLRIFKKYPDLCFAPETSDRGLEIRTMVQKQFECVLLASEYRKARLSKKAEWRTAGVSRTFSLEIFPDLHVEPRVRYKKMYYYLQVGEPLLRLVERFGWGVLIFPGLNLTLKSIDDFVDLVGTCHPNLGNMLHNLSLILPRLMKWGLPPSGFDFDNTNLENITEVGKQTFNSLFPAPACLKQECPKSLRPEDEILPWPSADSTAPVLSHGG